MNEPLRLAASICAGTVSASVMLCKLAGFPRQNPVACALREIGRIERTLFMLDWFADPKQRRRTDSILNEGEARIALARAIFFNRLGELRNRTFENQRHGASGLTLLTAAVTLWNTVSFDRAVRHLRASGVEVLDELLAHVAPPGWEHIDLTGDYLWSEMDKPRERFRPLHLHRTNRDAWRTFSNSLSPVPVCVANRQVFVYAPDGRELGRVDLPERPLALVFDGSDRRTLYVLSQHSVYRVAK